MLENVKSTVDDVELVVRRRAQLVQAAITLFSRVGYHMATVKDIADEAGVSPGLIYQYVPDKQDLLFLALLHICQRNKEEIPAKLKGTDDPISRLHVAIDSYTRIIAANQQAVVLTYRETKSMKREYIDTLKRMELETNALIANCIDECIRAGHLERVNVELLVYRIITGAHAWALKYWRLSKIVSLDEYLEKSIHSCWTTLLTPKGRRRYDELQAKQLLDGPQGQTPEQPPDTAPKRRAKATKNGATRAPRAPASKP
ncbi:MAG: TetR/AcrR family transcriptional regulator [Casimicrobiaceae bacterium]